MRFLIASIDTPGSDGTESMAVELSGLLGCSGRRQANTAAYIAPFPDDPCCRLPGATCSPVTVEFEGRKTECHVLDCCRPSASPVLLARWALTYMRVGKSGPANGSVAASASRQRLLLPPRHCHVKLIEMGQRNL